jgi:GT2 family glycosyltransferase
VIQLSIVIVNYKTPSLVIDCLATIERETSGIDYEVIVVDNDSGDCSGDLVLKAFPSVRWIDMGYNAGFARANNAGIRLSNGGIVLLLNPDTLIEDRAISGCYELLSASSYIACGVQLLNPDRSPQISGNFFMKGGLNYLLPLPYLGPLVKGVGGLLRVATPHVPDAGALVEVDWVNGAYLMVKREAIDLGGLLDEDFFLYAEEAEWCSRLRRLGKICIYGQFHVVHLEGASANSTFGAEGKGYYDLYDRKGLQIMLSNFVRIRKQFGIGWFLVQMCFYWLDIPVFGAGLLLSGLTRGGGNGRRYSWAMLRGFCWNVGYITARSGTIIRNKPYFYKVL